MADVGGSIALWNWDSQVTSGPDYKCHMEGEIYICQFGGINSMEFPNSSQGKVMSWSVTKYINSFSQNFNSFHVSTQKSSISYKYIHQVQVRVKIQLSSINPSVNPCLAMNPTHYILQK